LASSVRDGNKRHRLDRFDVVSFVFAYHLYLIGSLLIRAPHILVRYICSSSWWRREGWIQ
jgi:hypothetical protein